MTTSNGRAGRRRAGIAAHSGHGLLPRDITIVDGIPCTSVARTLLDLAEVINRRGLERAIDQAEVLRLLDMRAIEDVLARASGRRGAKLLRAVLAEHYAGSTLTANDLEELFLAMPLGRRALARGQRVAVAPTRSSRSTSCGAGSA